MLWASRRHIQREHHQHDVSASPERVEEHCHTDSAPLDKQKYVGLETGGELA